MTRTGSRNIFFFSVIFVWAIATIGLVGSCSDDSQKRDGAVDTTDQGSKEQITEICGDGVVATSERCDTKIAAGQPGACPTECDDQNACTIDDLINDGPCMVHCVHTEITSCANDDSCCPTGCTTFDDNDCEPPCGNGVLDTDERCDTAIGTDFPGACPTACTDGNDCTVDTLLNGGTCAALCDYAPILDCVNDDGCCPAGCNSTNDNDCSSSCGNGILESQEKCDTAIEAGQAGACPTKCDDGNTCSVDTLLNGGGCGAVCHFVPIFGCAADDGCCPSGCNSNNDSDCSPTCGNGIVENSELCDTKIAAGQAGACPTIATCNDKKVCTSDSVLNASTCGALCLNSAIQTCGPSEGCCPTGCNANNDSDCSPTCGNGALEKNELCDTKIAAGQAGACPALTSCNDGKACTLDSVLNAGTCAAQCNNSVITKCSQAEDGCCPTGCNANNDGDCSPVCGNSALEYPELCDTKIAAGQAGSCPTIATCNDGKACTKDSVLNPGTCAAECNNTNITACSSTSDGCCPTGCNANNDVDCSAACGNGVVEKNELCDTKITSGAGSCPNATTCNDGKACTIDSVLNAGTCTAQCSNIAITACSLTKDGCCPTGCNANNDADCSPVCGNAVVEKPETCDTKISSGAGSCPNATTCIDAYACTKDSVLNAGTCTAQCSNTNITTCSLTKDGCCPNICNAATDVDCPAVCGNGVLEPGEKCDIKISSGAGSCPTSASCEMKSQCATASVIGTECQAECVTQLAKDTAPCDTDGIYCTTQHCMKGSCVLAINGCDCLKDGDCTNGPACRLGRCDTSKWACTYSATDPAQEGLACDDGNGCTSNTVCKGGTCTGGQTCPPIGTHKTCSVRQCNTALNTCEFANNTCLDVFGQLGCCIKGSCDLSDLSCIIIK